MKNTLVQLATAALVIVALVAAKPQQEERRDPDVSDLPPDTQRRLSNEAFIRAETDFLAYGRRTPLDVFLPFVVTAPAVIEARAPVGLINGGRVRLLTTSTDLPTMFVAPKRRLRPGTPVLVVAGFSTGLPLELAIAGFPADGWQLPAVTDTPRGHITSIDRAPSPAIGATSPIRRSDRAQPAISRELYVPRVVVPPPVFAAPALAGPVRPSPIHASRGTF